MVRVTHRHHWQDLATPERIVIMGLRVSSATAGCANTGAHIKPMTVRVAAVPLLLTQSLVESIEVSCAGPQQYLLGAMRPRRAQQDMTVSSRTVTSYILIRLRKAWELQFLS